jgi:hypothetical protein
VNSKPSVIYLSSNHYSRSVLQDLNVMKFPFLSHISSKEMIQPKFIGLFYFTVRTVRFELNS